MPCILPFFEYFIEITGVIHAAEPRDFLNRGIAVAQKLFGMGDFFCQHIAYDRGAVLFFKFPRKIILADVELFGEKIEGDRLRVVLVQIVQNLFELAAQCGDLRTGAVGLGAD